MNVARSRSALFLRRALLPLALCVSCSDDQTQLPPAEAALGGLEVSKPGETGDPGDKAGPTPVPTPSAEVPKPDAPPPAGVPDGVPGSVPPASPEQQPEAPAGVWPGPALRNPVALPDAELARQALTLLGSSAVGADGSCRNCHSLGRPTLTRWSQLTQEVSRDCLAQPRLPGQELPWQELPDQAAVDSMFECLRERSGKPATRFSPESFGIYAAAAQLPWFTFLFEQASPQPSGTTTHADFVTRVGMPRAGEPWTQAEFDVVAEWFARQLPGLFELIPEDVGEACTPGLDPALAAHVAELSGSGWRAKNAQVPLLMYGCGPGQSGTACLADLPAASEQPFSAAWQSLAGSQIRVLHDNSQTLSAFWSRSSADGRYIGSGLVEAGASGFGGQILDLEQQRVIAGDFAYDATFFPDNSGFLMQRGGYDDGSDITPTDGSAFNEAVALICEQSVLASEPDQVSGDEAECTLAGGKFGLYQQTAKALDGGDYWVAHGSYQSDNGGFAPVLRQPSAAFDGDSSTTLTALLNDGNGFQVGNAVRLSTPRQGDPTLSPSGQLLVLRVKGREFNTTVGGFDVVAAEQSGYALYAVDATPASGSASATLRDLGRICLSGSKATFSYDERWLIFHRYVTDADALDLGFSGPEDPAFADYRESGASNLMLVDLSTGAARRITGMPPGQYALFPHFRSDGWIYFVVRTIDGREYFAASDAALTLE